MYLKLNTTKKASLQLQSFLHCIGLAKQIIARIFSQDKCVQLNLTAKQKTQKWP